MELSTKAWVFRILDGFFLCAVFILQSVIFSQYTVYSRADAEIPNHYVNPVFQKLLWLTGDLLCLMGFFLTSLLGFHHVHRRKEEKRKAEEEIDGGTKSDKLRNRRSPSKTEIQDDPESLPNTILRYISSSKIPLCYFSWLFYSTMLVLKISVVFGSDINEHMKQSMINKEPLWFDWQIFQLAVGLTAIIFSLLVEAHHDAGNEDPKRNAYLNSVSYGIALEILDTASLLVFIMPSFEHMDRHVSLEGEECPAEGLQPLIITLAALNLILPTVTLYKLTTSNFGEMYHVKLELIYNTLHLILVNVPFFIVRIYLWNASDREDVIFAIKNLYGIVGYFRGLFSEIRILKGELKRKKQQEQRTRVPSKVGNDRTKEDVEMSTLM